MKKPLFITAILFIVLTVFLLLRYGAVLQTEQDDYDESIRLCTQAIDSGELCQEKLSIAYYNRGNAWYDKGDYNSAIADYTMAIEIDPQYADVCNKLAWLKATCPDGTYRDGVRAVELGKKAVELKETYYTLGTLAAAYAEAGTFQDAIKTQKRAIQKLKEEGYGKKLAEYEERLASYKAGKPWRSKF
jgi:tetratricopeptide (TPR) repeat protein